MGVLQDAADAAGGGTLALTDGTWSARLELGAEHDGLRILGSCADGVSIDLDNDPKRPGLAVALGAGGTIELAGLTLRGPSGDGVVVDSGEVTLRDVTIDGYFGHALLAIGPESSLALSDVRLLGGDGEDAPESGGAIRVLDGARATGSDVTVEQAYAWGVYARGADTLIDLHRLTARDCRGPRGGPSAGASCALAREGGTVRLRESRLEAGMGSGAVSLSGDLEFEDVDVVGTVVTRDGYSSGAIAVISGSLTMSGGSIVDAFAAGVYLGDAGVTASLTDVEIAGIRRDELGINGFGVRVETLVTISTESQRPRLVIQGGSIVDTDGSALSTDPSARPAMQVDGLEISGANADDRPAGAAIVVLSGTLEASDLHVHDNRHSGLFAANADTRVTVADSTFERSESRPDYSAVGAFVVDAAEAHFESCTFRENASVGVLAWANGLITLDGGSVTDQVASESTTVGRGLHAEAGGTIIAAGVHISGNDGPGAVATAIGGLLLSDVVLEDNRWAGLFANSGIVELVGVQILDNVAHSSEGGGYGIYTEAIHELALILDDVEIAGSPIAAVVIDAREETLADPPAVEISNSQLQGSPADNADPLLATRGDGLRVCGGLGPWDGEVGLSIVDTEFRDAGRVGLLLHGSGATLGSGVIFSDNGIDAAQQPCEDVDGSLDDVPGALTCDQLEYEFLVECPGLEFTDDVPGVIGR